jgi:hypothetical protein
MARNSAITVKPKTTPVTARNVLTSLDLGSAEASQETFESQEGIFEDGVVGDLSKNSRMSSFVSTFLAQPPTALCKDNRNWNMAVC